MTTEDFQRKLTAILSADVVGYSRLMGADEAATVKTLETYKGVMFSLIKQHRGRVVDSPGDNLLAEFRSVVDAVQCAVSIQKELQARNAGLSENRRMEFRIGINLGDVIEEEDRIYGDGVNIAARLESLADPGGICISKMVFDQIESKLSFGYEFLGEQTVKNIAKPVGAYRVLMETRVVGAKTKQEAKSVAFWQRKIVLSLGVIVILLIVAGLYWKFYPRGAFIEPDSIKPEQTAVIPDIEEAPKTIAVLPFYDDSPEKDQDYFVDGLSEEILNSLAQIPELIVIARTSSFSFKGSNKTIQEIAAVLNVDNILEGSVRKAGNTLRITAQLVKAVDSSHFWSKTYNRELDVKQIFDVQEDIAANVANELKLTFGIGELPKKTGRTDNLEAYDAYLMGWQHFRKMSATNLAKAIEYYQKAIDLDNNFAQAYVGLADSYMAYSSYAALHRDEYHQKAETAIELALDIDDQLSEAYTALGMLRFYQSNNEKTEAAFKLSIELNSNNGRAHTNYVNVLLYEGRFEEAFIHIQKGIELDPLNVAAKVTKAWVLECLGRFDEAFKQYNKIIEIDPQFWMAIYRMGNLYYRLGRFYEAAKMFRKANSLDPDSPWDIASLGQVYLDSGDTELAEYWFGEAAKKSPQFSYSNLGMFFLNAYLGQEESAKKYGLDIQTFDADLRILALSYFGDLDLKAGHYNEARKWFADDYPELLDPKKVNIGLNNYQAAISLAHVLIKTGEKKHADMLLNKSMAYIKTLPRLGDFGYGIADARIYMLQGKKKDALNSLREAVDNGWRIYWRYYLEVESILEPLHDNPEFKAIVQEIKDDMAAQLVQVRELEKNDPDWQ